MNQAASNVRLSKGPGRPKKVESGRITDIVDDQVCGREGLQALIVGQIAIPPRLLNLEAAAVYLGISPWTIRDLEAAGVLNRVRVPLPDGRELGKLLFDRCALDRLIRAWKDSAV